MHTLLRVTILLYAVFSLLPRTSALYFQINDGQKRCFIQDVPVHTLVLGKYKSLDHSKLFVPSAGGVLSTLDIVVRSPQGQEVLTHSCQEEGRMAFTANEGGEHQICVQIGGPKSADIRTFRFSLELQSGDGATDYGEIAKQEHLGVIDVEVRRLNDKLKLIKSALDLQRSREEQFRNTTESTNARVMWFSILQTLILIGVGIAQIYLLRRFFKSKKLA